jgi:hypothetical protein
MASGKLSGAASLTHRAQLESQCPDLIKPLDKVITRIQDFMQRLIAIKNRCQGLADLTLSARKGRT